MQACRFCSHICPEYATILLGSPVSQGTYLRHLDLNTNAGYQGIFGCVRLIPPDESTNATAPEFWNGAGKLEAED